MATIGEGNVRVSTSVNSPLFFVQMQGDLANLSVADAPGDPRRRDERREYRSESDDLGDLAGRAGHGRGAVRAQRAGDPVVFDGSDPTKVDLENNLIDIGSHNFSTGDSVVYRRGFDDIDLASGVVNAIIDLLEGNLEGATLSFDGSSGTIVDLANDKILVASNFAGSVLDAANDQLDLGGSHPFTTGDEVFLVRDNVAAVTFDGSDDASVVDTGTDELTLGAGHGLTTGDAVVYLHGDGGTDIEGLTDGQTYFRQWSSTNAAGIIQLAETFDKATQMTPDVVELTGAGTGTGHSLSGTIGGLTDGVAYFAVVDSGSSNLVGLAASSDDAAAMTPVLIDLTGTAPGTGYRLTRSRFITGDQVVYSNGDGLFGATSIEGLDNRATFFVAIDANGDIQLAASRGDAVAPVPTVVDLTSLSSNAGHELIGAGRSIGGLVDERVYYVVDMGGNQIGLATSRDNATMSSPELIDLVSLSQGTVNSLRKASVFGALNILKKLDSTDPSPVTRNDIRLELLTEGQLFEATTTTSRTSSSNFAGSATTTSSKFKPKKPKIKGFEFEMNIGQADILDLILAAAGSDARSEFDVSFDLGIPAVGLDVDAVVDISLGWDLRLNFGYDTDFKFYTHTDKAKFGESSVPEMTMVLAATVKTPKDEAQGLTVLASQGSYKLKFMGQETDLIAFNATSGTVQTALEGLSTIGSGNVTVTPLSNESDPTSKSFQIRFKGSLAGQDLENIIPVNVDLMDGLDDATLTIEELAPVAPVSGVTGLPLGASATGNLGPLTLTARDLVAAPGETDTRKLSTRLAATFSVDIKDPDRNILPLPVPEDGRLTSDVELTVGVPVTQEDGSTVNTDVTFIVPANATKNNNQKVTFANPIELLREDVQKALDDALEMIETQDTQFKQTGQFDKVVGLRKGDIEVKFNPFTFGFDLKVRDQGVIVEVGDEGVQQLVEVLTEQDGSSLISDQRNEKQLIIFSPQATASPTNPFEISWKPRVGAGGTSQITALTALSIKAALEQLPRIGSGNVSVSSVDIDDLQEKVPPPTGSKVFRVEFTSDSGGLFNLGNANQNELVVTNPRAKGTAAEEGSNARVRITFSKDAFLRSDARFQVGFNGKIGNEFITKSGASNETFMFTQIQSALVKSGLPDTVVGRTPDSSGNSMALSRVNTTDGTIVWDVLFAGPVWQRLGAPKLVVQTPPKNISSTGTSRIEKQISNAKPVEVDKDGDRLTFSELRSGKFKARDIIEAKINFGVRVNLFLDLFIADDSGSRNPVIPRLTANFHLAQTIADVVLVGSRGTSSTSIFTSSPIPVTENGRLDEDLKILLTLKTGGGEVKHTLRLAALETQNNGSVFDLVTQLQRKVDIVVGKNRVKVTFDQASRKILIDKDRDATSTSNPITKVDFWVSKGLPNIAFTGVSLGLGSFLGDFLLPTLGTINDVIAPLDFLIGDGQNGRQQGIATARLPVISDVSGQDVTLLTLAGIFGNNQTAQFIEGIQRIRSTLDDLDAAAADASQPNREFKLNFGDFELQDFVGNKGLNQVDLNTEALQNRKSDGSNPADQVPDGAAKRTTASLTTRPRTEGSFKFEVPLLTDPTQAFKMLMGQFDSVTFFTADLPKFVFGFDYEVKFNIFGPLFATLRGGFGAEIDLAFGYDGTGIANFQRSGNFGQVFDGFFISDTENADGTGRDVAELTFSGEIAAGASLNAAVAEAGVEGGIAVNVFLNLNDPNRDGRVRFSEMAGNIEANSNLGPGALAAIFDISGKMEWFFRAYVEVLWGLWRKEWELGRGTIFEFEIPFKRVPVLASNQGEGGRELLLHIGDNAAARLQGNTVDNNETFIVSGNSNKVDVTFNDNIQNITVTQSYYGVDKVIGFGGEEADNVDFTGLSGVDVEFFGGVGNDTIKGGSGKNSLFGEDGDDTIEGGASDDTIFGGMGMDTIKGFAGNDSINAQEGDDTVDAGPGDDLIIGGEGDDSLTGGTGGDTYVFTGGWGVDTIVESNETGQMPPLVSGQNDPLPDVLNFALVPFALTHDVTSSGIEVIDSTGSKVTHTGLEIEQIVGARGFDEFNIQASGAQGLQLDGVRGSDRYTITSSTDIAGPVLIQDTGPVFNFDQLVLNASASADTLVVTEEKASFIAAGPSGTNIDIAYRPTPPGATDPVDSGIEVIGLNTLGGADTIYVESTPLGSTLTLDGGADSDTFNVGVGLNQNSGTLDGITGNTVFATPLVIKGESEDLGGDDTLNLFDNADTAANTGEIFERGSGATRVEGLGMAVPIEFSRIDDFSLSLGSGGDTFDVISTHRGSFTLNAGGGADTINIQEIKAGSGIFNGAVIDGQGGADTFNLGDKAPEPFLGLDPPIDAQGSLNAIRAPLTVRGGGGSDTLNVDESEDGNNNGVLTANQIIGLTGRTSFGDKPDITYETFEALNLLLGKKLPAGETRSDAAFNDVFIVEDTHSGTTTIDTFDGADSVEIRGISGSTFLRTGNDDDRIDVGDRPAGATTDEYNIIFRGQLTGVDVDTLLTQETQVFDLGSSATSNVTLAEAPAGGIVAVTVNGVQLVQGTDYTLNGTTVTFTNPQGGVTANESFDLSGDGAASTLQLANEASTSLGAFESFDLSGAPSSTVTLQGQFVSGTVSVEVGGVALSSDRFSVSGQVVTFLDGGVIEVRSDADIRINYELAVAPTSVTVSGESEFFDLSVAPANSVTLQGQFVSGSVRVFVGGVELTGNRFNVSGQDVSFLDGGGMAEERSDAGILVTYDVALDASRFDVSGAVLTFLDADGNEEFRGGALVQTVSFGGIPTQDVVLVGNFVPGTVNVIINGVALDPTRFAVSGDVLTFLDENAMPEGRTEDNVDIVYDVDIDVSVSYLVATRVVATYDVGTPLITKSVTNTRRPSLAPLTSEVQTLSVARDLTREQLGFSVTDAGQTDRGGRVMTASRALGSTINGTVLLQKGDEAPVAVALNVSGTADQVVAGIQTAMDNAFGISTVSETFQLSIVPSSLVVIGHLPKDGVVTSVKRVSDGTDVPFTVDGRVITFTGGQESGDVEVIYDARNVNVGIAGNKLTIGHEFDTLSFADTFTLTFTDPNTSGVVTTAPIPVGATPAMIQSALELLPGIDPGDVSVRRVGVVDRIQGQLDIDGGAGNVTPETVQDGATPDDIAEIQVLRVLATEGTYTLTMTRTTTMATATSNAIAFDADATTIRDELVTLANQVFTPDFTVTSSDISVVAAGNDFLITFGGSLAGVDVDALTTDETGLNGGTATVVTAVNGFNPAQLEEIQKFTISAGAGTFALGFLEPIAVNLDDDPGNDTTATFTESIFVGATEQFVRDALWTAILSSPITVDPADITASQTGNPDDHPIQVVFGVATNSYTVTFGGVTFTGVNVPLLTIDPQTLAFANVLNVVDSGETERNEGEMTATTITGLDMTSGIVYADVAEINVDLGANNDEFAVESTHINPTFIEGFGGDDVITVATIIGPTTVNAGAAADIINVSDLVSPATDGTLDQIAAPLTVQGGGIDLMVETVTRGSQNGPVNEVQRLTVDGLPGEQFELEFDGQTTFVPIDFDASAQDVEDALNDMLRTVSVGGTVQVIKEQSPTPASPHRVVYRIEFRDGLGGRNVTPLIARAVADSRDTLNIDDAADNTDNTDGLLTATTLTGLGMTAANGQPGIVYSRFESMILELGSGNDMLRVHGTHDGRVSIDTGGGGDTVEVEKISGRTSIAAGAGEDLIVVNPNLLFPDNTRDNQIGAELTLDGGEDSDDYIVSLSGNGSSLINVFDSGVVTGEDVLTVNGTEFDDTFLLRANAGQSLGFVALLNNDGINAGEFDQFERVNYDRNINQRLIVNAAEGDDTFAVDDNAATMTLNGGIGNDTFQFGQMFASERTPTEAGVRPDDVFATIETTRGFLSNGISFATTANGGAGEDVFVVFHNLAVLSLNGGDGDDDFTVRAFALVGSQDNLQERTEIDGGGGADLVKYAVNAPVAINGGDGFDTVTVVGTEFGDDFVVNEDGVFGAGLNVNFVGVESLTVDGAEGDDRFFVQGTGEDLTTEIIGGLGSDSIVLAGDTPSVVSNDLLGHSGLITHDVESIDPLYDDLKVDEISTNIADNDEPAIRITPSGGVTRVTEGETLLEGFGFDTYTVVLTRRPTRDVIITLSADELSEEDKAKQAALFTLSADINDPGDTGLTLTFTPDNWDVPQTVFVRAVDDVASEGTHFGNVGHSVISRDVFADLAVVSISGAASVINEVEGNDTPTTANPVSRSSFATTPNVNVGDASIPWVEIRGDVRPANDDDFYSFNLLANEKLILDIDFAMLQGDWLDTVLQVVDINGVQVAGNSFNDDNLTALGGGGSAYPYDSYLEFVAPADGDYYVKVTSYVNHFFPFAVDPNPAAFDFLGAGDYTLHASIDGQLTVGDPDLASLVLQTGQVPAGQDLRGATVQITDGPGKGQSRTILSTSGDTLFLLTEWDADDVPTQDSTARIVADDSVRGLVTRSLNNTFRDSDANFSAQGDFLVGDQLIGQFLEVTKSEVQIVTIAPGTTAFTLDFGASNTTESITFDENDPAIGTGDEVRVALERVAGIEKGDVDVSRDGSVYTVTFLGNLAGTDVTELTGSTGVTVATVTQGGSATETLQIVSNTNDSLTVVSEWSVLTPAPGDAYRVLDGVGGNLYQLLDGNGAVAMIDSSPVTFTGDVSSIVNKTFTDAGADLPDDVGNNLRGATIEIVAGTGVGQVRLIEFNTDQQIRVTSPWRVAPDATSLYKISRFDGIQLPNLKVQITDNDEAGLAVFESDESTDVTEGAISPTVGAVDTYDVHLTRPPVDTTGGMGAAAVTVTVGSLEGQLLFKGPNDSDFVPTTTMDFDDTNWDIRQSLEVRALDDAVIEGSQFELITHTLTSALDKDSIGSATDQIVVDNPQSSLLLSHRPITGATVGVVTTDGDPGDETVAVTVPGSVVGGTFTLKFGGESTSDLAFNADPSVVEDELELLLTIGDGNISVTGTPGNYVITFQNALGGQDVGDVTADGSDLFENITVTVDDGTGPVSVSGSRFVVTSNVLTFKDAAGATELRSGTFDVTYDFDVPGFDGANAPRVTAAVSDNEAPGVLITQTNGSTDLIEGRPAHRHRDRCDHNDSHRDVHRSRSERIDHRDHQRRWGWTDPHDRLQHGQRDHRRSALGPGQRGAGRDRRRGLDRDVYT